MTIMWQTPIFMCPLYHSTTPPPNVRVINGYVTVEPPLIHQEQRRWMEIYTAEEHSTPTSFAPSDASSALPALVHSTLTLSFIFAWMLSQMLLTSWPQDRIISLTLKTPVRPHQSSGMHLINKKWSSTHAESRWRTMSWSRTRLLST